MASRTDLVYTRTAMSEPHYLALDFETTGLHPSTCRIIEVGISIVDDALDELFSWSSVVACPDAAVQVCDDHVRVMHLRSKLFVPTSNGMGYMLTTEEPHIPLAQAETVLIEVAAKFPHKPILIGSSVHFDRGFIKHWMPDLDMRLSHRHLDSSAVKMALEIPWPPQESVAHRALKDAQYSVQVIRAAREAV